MYTDDDLYVFGINIIRRMIENILLLKDTPVKGSESLDESPDVKEINGSEMPPQNKKQRKKILTRRRKLQLGKEEEEKVDETLLDSDTNKNIETK